MDEDDDGTVDTAETDEVSAETPHPLRRTQANAKDGLFSVSQGGPEVPRLQSQTQQLPPYRPLHQCGGHVVCLEKL